MRMVRVLAAVLLGFGLALPALAAGPKGPLVVAGGEFGFANPGWRRLVELAGGAGAPVLVVPTASTGPEAAGARIVEHLKSLGAAAELLPLYPGGEGRADASGIASDPAWVARARAARGFYFTGGDQTRITAALLRPDGGPTPLLEAIRGRMPAAPSSAAPAPGPRSCPTRCSARGRSRWTPWRGGWSPAATPGAASASSATAGSSTSISWRAAASAAW